MRVVILKEYAKKNFPATPLLDYAIEVEKITTSKVIICQESGRNKGKNSFYQTLCRNYAMNTVNTI